jgi:hypothetical protein
MEGTKWLELPLWVLYNAKKNGGEVNDEVVLESTGVAKMVRSAVESVVTTVGEGAVVLGDRFITARGGLGDRVIRGAIVSS